MEIDIVKPFQNVLNSIVESLPKIVGFIGFIIFAWLFIKIFLWITKKILIKSNVDKWGEKLSETKIFGNTTIDVMLTKVILGTLKWFLILVFIMAGSEIFGLQTVSDGIKSFFAYLPRLITALAIFAGGAYLGTILKNTIISLFKSLEINGGNLVGNIVFYLIVIFLSITALDHAGVDTSIIKSNLTLLIGSILLAFTIAFGLGARDAVLRLLFGYYSRRNIDIGEKISVQNDSYKVEGVVVAIDNICLTIESEQGKIVLPIKDIVNSRVTKTK